MSSTNPRLTIITANYNSGDKLVQTCESVASQEADYEHLIMDSVSTDGSLELANRLTQRMPKLKVRCEKDFGPYDAFNKGIAQARGDYIYFIGAGDVMLPGALKQMCPYLPRNLASFVYGDVMLDGKRYDGKFTRRMLLDKNICHQGIFHGKKCFELCGIYDLKYRMIADAEFNMRCFANRRIKKKYVPIVVAIYEGGGISTEPDRAFGADKDMLIRKHFGIPMLLQLRLEHYRSRLMQEFAKFFS